MRAREVDGQESARGRRARVSTTPTIARRVAVIYLEAVPGMRQLMPKQARVEDAGYMDGRRNGSRAFQATPDLRRAARCLAGQPSAQPLSAFALPSGLAHSTIHQHTTCREVRSPQRCCECFLALHALLDVCRARFVMDMKDARGLRRHYLGNPISPDSGVSALWPPKVQLVQFKMPSKFSTLSIGREHPRFYEQRLNQLNSSSSPSRPDNIVGHKNLSNPLSTTRPLVAFRQKEGMGP